MATVPILKPGNEITGKNGAYPVVLMAAPQPELCCRCCENGAGDWKENRGIYCDFDGGRSGFIDGNACVCRTYIPYKARINELFSPRRFTKIQKEYMQILRPEIWYFELKLSSIMKGLKNKHNVSLSKFRDDVLDIFEHNDMKRLPWRKDLTGVWE